MQNNNEITTSLSKFGISRDESEIYLALLSSRALTAQEIARQQKMLVNSVYRCAENLIDNGLIVELGMRPKKFQATSPVSAIENLSRKHQAELKKTANFLSDTLATNQDPNRLKMSLMTGQEIIFENFVELANCAKSEILVISVGEPVPDTIWRAIKESIIKGIKPKFIFHRYDKDNILLVKRWQTQGVEVRHMPIEGYHLYIFDSYTAVLAASNPEESKERTGVVIYNKAIIEALRTYFFQQWEQSKPL